MRAWIVAIACAAIVVLGTVGVRLAHAHGGAIDTGSGVKGPVTLTTEQIKALGLQTVAAETRPMESLLAVHGELAALSDAQADVTLRISGTVRAVYVKPGAVVRKGDRLALIESRVVGNPPPTIVVTAPIDGIVDVLSVTVGQSVEPNTTLFHVSNLTRMRVIGKVYEEDLGKVRLNQAAHVKLLAYPAELFEGTLSFIGPTLDEQTRTVDVWVALDNAKGLLKPNLFARIDIVLGSNKTALAVPSTAVLEASGEKFVFVREGNKFNRVDIEAGASDDSYTEVLSGLVPGDEVVTVGVREVYTKWLMGSAATADAD